MIRAAERSNGNTSGRANTGKQIKSRQEVHLGGFGLLSGQNRPPEGEQGAQPS